MGDGDGMLFESWMSVGRTVLAAVLAYAWLVGLLRVSGKRTLAKLNAFDLVITVALGSTLATVVLSKDVPLLDGLLALLLLVLLQYIVAWLNVRSAAFRKAVKNSPTVLVSRGEFHEEQLARERIVEGEVRQAMRNAGFADPAGVTVILETDGTLSVLCEPDRDAASRRPGPDTL
jgi:uncharacterized membrane protein YcaP (DUF421 family)